MQKSVRFIGFTKTQELLLRLITDPLSEISENGQSMLSEILEDVAHLYSSLNLGSLPIRKSLLDLGEPLTFLRLSNKKPFLLRNFPEISSRYNSFFSDPLPSYDESINTIAVPAYFEKYARGPLFRISIISQIANALFPGSSDISEFATAKLLFCLNVLFQLQEISQETFEVAINAILDYYQNALPISLVDVESLPLQNFPKKNTVPDKLVLASSGEINLASAIFEQTPERILFLLESTKISTVSLPRDDHSFFLFSYRDKNSSSPKFSLRRYGVDNPVSEAEAWVYLSTQAIDLFS